MEFVRVASLAEIPEGEARSYEIPVGRVAVAHVENRLFAFSDDCTHAGCSLSDGELDDRIATVTCPCHGSVFDIETGEPVEGPAVDPLAVHAVRLEDGWVEVGASPSDGS